MNELMTDRKPSSLFATIQAEPVTLIFDRAAALATVFLVVKLGWEHASSIFAAPLPILMAILCFFHVMDVMSRRTRS